MRNRASPIVSSASDRRSQVRTTSVSKIVRRRLWISRSRSNPAGRGQAGRIERLDLREVRLLGGELGEQRVARAVAEAMVLGVDAEIRPDDRVVADDPPEAGLDEVVEAVVERRRHRLAGVGAGEDDVLESVGHGFLSVRRASPARAVRQTPWSVPGGDGIGGGSPGRRPRARRRRRRSVASMSDSVIPWWVTARTCPWGYSTIRTLPARSAVEEGRRSRSTRNRTKFVRTAIRIERPVAGLGDAAGADDAVAARRALRRAAGRCDDPLRSRSIIPSGPSARATSPAAASDPGLAHAATEQLPRAAGTGDERVDPRRRATRSGRRAPSTGRTRPSRPARRAPAARRRARPTALKNRAPSTWSGTPWRWAIAATAAMYDGGQRLVHRVGVGVLEDDEPGRRLVDVVRVAECRPRSRRDPASRRAGRGAGGRTPRRRPRGRPPRRSRCGSRRRRSSPARARGGPAATTRLAIVPEATNSPASLPSSSAARSSSALTVGSSPQTSSPTSAAAIARRIAAVGFVTVSERRSMRDMPAEYRSERRSGPVRTARAAERDWHGVG